MTRSALRIIRNEHQALAAMLHALRALAARMGDNPQSRDFDALRAIVFYIDEFPERLHHRKESATLFPRLRARSGAANAVLDRLDAEHERGERAIRDLEHDLLAFEQMGAARRQAFMDSLDRYTRFYAEHMRVEESEVLPLAERTLTDEDWRVIDRDFEANRDPLTGAEPEEAYRALFQKILSITPAPIGLGPT